MIAILIIVCVLLIVNAYITYTTRPNYESIDDISADLIEIRDRLSKIEKKEVTIRMPEGLDKSIDDIVHMRVSEATGIILTGINENSISYEGIRETIEKTEFEIN